MIKAIMCRKLVPGPNILLLEYHTGDKSDNVSKTGTGTKHFTLGVLVPVIKASKTGTGILISNVA